MRKLYNKTKELEVLATSAHSFSPFIPLDVNFPGYREYINGLQNKYKILVEGKTRPEKIILMQITDDEDDGISYSLQIN